MKPPRHEIPSIKLNPNQQFPEVVVYWDKNFLGESWRTNLSYSYLGEHWEGLISSVIVLAGIWEFWSGTNFTGCSCKLSAGFYPSFKGEWCQPEFVGKCISSFRCVSA
jgi:hypothetical protein